MVTQTISNPAAQGEIKIMGQHWTARSADGREIPEGTMVRVLEIVGVKAIVEPMEAAGRKEVLECVHHYLVDCSWAYFIVHCISYFCDCTAGTRLYYRTLRQLSSNLEKWCTF